MFAATTGIVIVNDERSWPFGTESEFWSCFSRAGLTCAHAVCSRVDAFSQICADMQARSQIAKKNTPAVLVLVE